MGSITKKTENIVAKIKLGLFIHNVYYVFQTSRLQSHRTSIKSAIGKAPQDTCKYFLSRIDTTTVNFKLECIMINESAHQNIQSYL